ncbi:acyl-CoA dehydrogenase C-terminal domain-containing protein, partial [Escherichia coli]
VQALDLIGRKVLLSSKGKVVREYTAEILKFCAAHARNKYLRRFAWDLTKLCAQWNTLTVRIMLAARKDRDIVSSASVDFLMFSGYVMMAYFWAQQAVVASEKLEAGNGQETPEFYKAKIKVADFYFDRLLPRAQGHAE